MSNSVSVDDKNFVGIGKMTFDTNNVEWNIPHLHFLVDKSPLGDFEATLLEFGLVSSGATQEESIEGLASQTRDYIVSVTEKSSYQQFIDDVNTCVMENYWRQYRCIEFSLARKGNDLSHEMGRDVIRAVKSIMSEKMKDVLNSLVQEQAAEIVDMVKKILSVTPTDIQYSIINEAA
jgi:hypothetical protein